MNTFDTPAFFYQMFQGIPEAVVILDREDRVVVVNEQFEQFFGYDGSEIRGRYINDLVVPENLLEEGELFSRLAMRGTSLSSKAAIRCRSDGTRVDVSITARPIYVEGQQTGMVAMYRDIADQVILLDSIDTHIWYLKNPDTYGAVNEAHARFYGLSKAEMQNRRLEEFFDREKAQLLRRNNAEVFASGTTITTEHWARRADGATRLLRIRKKPRVGASGSINYVVCSAEDITAARERENQLRLLSSMVEWSADPMIRMDADYRITYMNPAAENHYGYTLEEVRGKDPAIFNAEENAEEIQREIRATIMAGEVYEGRIRNRRRDGSTYVALLRIAPITDEKGELIGFVDVQRDITSEQRELENKDLLLREVQHRVKNNLATVVSLLSLQSSSLEEPSAVDALNDARRRIEAMLTVYETLRNAGTDGTIDLRGYLHVLIARLEDTLNSRNPIRFHSDERSKPIESSAAMSVGMIVNELITNAVKHAFPDDRKGTITVELDRVASETDEEAAVYRIVVADDGVSIPDAVSAEGIGGNLGLTLVYSMVEKIHGSIVLERDGGTHFTLTIDSP